MNYDRAGFRNLDDYDKYIKSLHMEDDIVREFSKNDSDPESYSNIPGNDTPGDFRDLDVPYQPIEYVSSLESITNPNGSAYYYDDISKGYYQWLNNAWQAVSSSRMDYVLDNKAYIDMPNLNYMTFLNPRDVFFGLKFNINYNIIE